MRPSGGEAVAGSRINCYRVKSASWTESGAQIPPALFGWRRWSTASGGLAERGDSLGTRALRGYFE